MNTLHLRTYRCPYCFDECKTSSSEWSDDVEMAPNCGHTFTLGEAKRGRPDPDPAITNDMTTLKNRVAALEEWVAALEQRLDRH
jgi:hypothetical protein